MTGDLTPLFTPPAAPAAFQQGVVTAFDPLTGLNTVTVGGVPFTNLPLLNVPDVVNITIGSVVMLARLGSSLAIMGRVVTPNVGTILNTSAVSTFCTGNSATNFALTTSATLLTSAVVPVPAWANVATSLVVVDVSAKNTTGVADFLQASAIINGTPGGESLQETAAGNWQSGSASAIRNTFPVTPGGSFTIGARARSNLAGWSADANNVANCNSVTLFQHV